MTSPPACCHRQTAVVVQEEFTLFHPSDCGTCLAELSRCACRARLPMPSQVASNETAPYRKYIFWAPSPRCVNRSSCRGYRPSRSSNPVSHKLVGGWHVTYSTADRDRFHPDLFHSRAHVPHELRPCHRAGRDLDET